MYQNGLKKIFERKFRIIEKTYYIDDKLTNRYFNVQIKYLFLPIWKNLNPMDYFSESDYANNFHKIRDMTFFNYEDCIDFIKRFKAEGRDAFFKTHIKRTQIIHDLNKKDLV